MTMTTTKPKSSQVIEEWLASHGVEYRLLRIPLTAIDARRSLRNQARFQPLDERVVATYAEAVAEGTSFPPIVVNDDGKANGYLTIDGNHRFTAHQLAGREEIDAYVLTNLSDRQISVLTFDANTKHGLPTTEEERKQHAVFLVETAGISQRDAAKMLNVPFKDLNYALQTIRADRRFARLGIERWDSIGKTLRARLDNIRNDNVLVEAANLVIRSKMPHDQVSEFVGEINKIGSEAEALAFIASRREALVHVISETIGGRTTIPQNVLRLNRSLSYAENITIEAIDPKAMTPSTREQYRNRIDAAIARLTEVKERLIA